MIRGREVFPGRPAPKVMTTRRRRTLTRCGFCGWLVQLTVDDSGLCMSCDALVFPHLDDGRLGEAAA